MILSEDLGDILAGYGSNRRLVLLLTELLTWQVGALASYGRSRSIDRQMVSMIHVLGVRHIPEAPTHRLSSTLKIVDLLQSVHVVSCIGDREMVNTDVAFDTNDMDKRKGKDVIQKQVSVLLTYCTVRGP